ncbi:MAG: N-acetylmuramoyl-L-alanine amidase [Saprospiraceae bacterium]|nr:N-acetylmuramoyl-L-alanine amidase [Saprospiraceae bacterium]
MSLLVTYITSLFLFLDPASNEPYYHSVHVNDGDGCWSLLRRYGLDDHSCNFDHFYRINDLKKEDVLIKGKKYKIPVLIYRYNGKSIRSSIGNDDWDKAIRIKEYNEMLLKRGLRRTHYTESRILWVPYNEIHCSTTDQPTAVRTSLNSEPAESTLLNEPLFGEKYSSFSKVDNSLDGQVFYIVAGHGGPDPGAIAHNVGGAYNLCEDEYAYDVSLRLMRQLRSRGATVHMIIEDANDGIRDDLYLDCDKDERCNGKYIPLNQLDRLRQRVMVINKLHRDHIKKGIKNHKVICIHVDSRAAQRRQDVFFYYYGKSHSGKNLASNLHATFKEKYKKYQADRGYYGTLGPRPLYMLRKTNPPAVYVELANIKNGLDRERLVRKENREALARWLAEGLTK